MNPMMLLQAKQRLDVFRNDHPKVFPFFRHIKEKAMEEGAVFEMKVTATDGKEYVSNIRMNANDVETIKMILDALGGED